MLHPSRGLDVGRRPDEGEQPRGPAGRGGVQTAASRAAAAARPLADPEPAGDPGDDVSQAGGWSVDGPNVPTRVAHPRDVPAVGPAAPRAGPASVVVFN